MVGGRDNSGSLRRRANRLVLGVCCAGLLSGCDPTFWQWLNDAGRDAATRDSSVDAATDSGGPTCADESALDLEYDKRMDIDCNAVRSALVERRGAAVSAELARRAAAMRASFTRCCVSREQLVLHRRPFQGQGLPTDPDVLREGDRFVGMTLCDELTRELAVHRYIEDHPECLSLSSDVIPQTGGAR
jgi:hypothetical protein